MYPDWPQSPADLVPLPLCDGPKLKPFPFPAQQEMEFLEYLGEGAHSHVFKIRIMGQVYALKLFRFLFLEDWFSPTRGFRDDREAITAFANYSEPFYCECRAFGRLQETGYEELATRCFGYLLLDEKHEQAMMNQFSDLKLEFNGNIDCAGCDDLRAEFPGKGGRLPPIRGIVKEFGYSNEALGTFRTPDARRILRDIIRLQQLGIFRSDPAARQLIGGKLCDFSTALTVPHYVATPELNPHLTPESISALEYETFNFCMDDYYCFDEMITIWNEEQKNKISWHAVPSSGPKLKWYLKDGLMYPLVPDFLQSAYKVYE
ncbi:hypothetical protein E4U41_000981 [Claviceps citrina]|nr:hypothetical protein E4U41_000981 [Claviceps citrina]